MSNSNEDHTAFMKQHRARMLAAISEYFDFREQQRYCTPACYVLREKVIQAIAVYAGSVVSRNYADVVLCCNAIEALTNDAQRMTITALIGSLSQQE